MKKHIGIIIAQALFLALVIGIIYFIYPKADANINGNWVRFNSINANVIMISENPDFSNPRYIEIEKGKNISYSLNPGTYYWKSDNGLIAGWKNKLVIESEVGMKIEREENESNLVNIGNVKINVTKNKEGKMVGRIILEPSESEKIEDKGNYTGRQSR